MIVTCPKCEARYAVDPLAVGPSGRTVQCARCDHRWFQKVEGPPPTPDLLIRPPTRGSALPVPVETKTQSRWAGRVAVVVVILLVLGGLGAGGYFYRDTLMGWSDRLVAKLPSQLKSLPFFGNSSSTTRPAAPPARAAAPAPAVGNASLAGTPGAPAAPATSSATDSPAASSSATPASSATAGSSDAPAPRLDPPAAPAQLEVDLSASKIDLVDGRYVIRGEVANRGGAPGTTAKLVIVFKKNNDVLATRSYPMTLGPIAPGERANFSQALDSPPAGATDIVPSVE